ncbi:MAG: hypothetical protein ACQCN5_06805 [Candidatus Bathyarchaeia archaeon]
MFHFNNLQSMPTLDIAMPLALLLVVTAAVFLNKKAESRLKASVEEKEFQTKDILMLVVVMAIVISTIAVASFLNPGDMFENVLLAIFLGSYTMLLFTFTYLFSDLKKRRAQLLSVGFGVASLIAGVASLLGPLVDQATIFRVGAFIGLAFVCFAVAAYEQMKPENKKAKWYIAMQPPALFLLLFVFFNLIHFEGTLNVWFPVLLDIFGATFAILIILYLSPMFNWKTVGIFAVLLTILDVILVFSGPMVAAAKTFSGLGLPVLIYLPNVPLHFSAEGVIGLRGLGLGDFFFAGILAIQTFNQFGKKYAYASVIAMTLAFGIWEAFLPEIVAFFNIGGFPATVCIITGWIPIVAIATLLHKKQKGSTPLQTEPSNIPST